MKEVTAATSGYNDQGSRTSVSTVTQQHPEQQEVRLSDGLLHVAGEVVLYGRLNLTYKSSGHRVDCGWVSTARIDNNMCPSYLWFSLYILATFPESFKSHLSD